MDRMLTDAEHEARENAINEVLLALRHSGYGYFRAIDLLQRAGVFTAEEASQIKQDVVTAAESAAGWDPTP